MVDGGFSKHPFIHSQREGGGFSGREIGSCGRRLIVGFPMSYVVSRVSAPSVMYIGKQRGSEEDTLLCSML